MTYARDIESVRKKDTKRADARKAREERKAKEARKIEDEKKREIKKKKREIVDKLTEIQRASGIEGKKKKKSVLSRSKQSTSCLISHLTDSTLKEMDLDEDFDPDQWDKKMQSIFNEDYYNADDDEKPVFDSDDEGSYEETHQLSNVATASSFLAKQKEEKSADQDEEMNEGEQEGDNEMHENDENNNEEYNEDEENPEGNIIYDESGEGRKSKRKMKKDRKKLKNLPLKDYFDEIYKLDYEDIVSNRYLSRSFVYTNFYRL